jgi:hypothetical protein
MLEVFGDSQTWTKQISLGLAVSLSKNDRLGLVFALVGDTPLEYQRTPVTLSLAIPLKRFSFHGFYCSKEVGHARVNPLSI